MIEGNWDACEESLAKILRNIWPGDGPSEAMYRFMAEYSFKCPPNWNGYHVLDAETLANASREPVDLDAEEIFSPLGMMSPRVGVGNRIGGRPPSAGSSGRVSNTHDKVEHHEGRGSQSLIHRPDLARQDSMPGFNGYQEEQEEEAVVEHLPQWRKVTGARARTRGGVGRGRAPRSFFFSCTFFG